MIKIYKCLRCGHEWVGRKTIGEKPQTCSKCRSHVWEKPKDGEGFKNAQNR